MWEKKGRKEESLSSKIQATIPNFKSGIIFKQSVLDPFRSTHMPFFDVKIFCGSTSSEYYATNQVYDASLCNIDDGSFWFNARIPKFLYETAMQNQNSKKPYHAFIQGEIVDIIINQEFLGPVIESRQRLDLTIFKMLPSDIYVPKNLITTFTPSMKLFTF